MPVKYESLLQGHTSSIDHPHPLSETIKKIFKRHKASSPEVKFLSHIRSAFKCFSWVECFTKISLMITCLCKMVLC